MYGRDPGGGILIIELKDNELTDAIEEALQELNLNHRVERILDGG